MSRPGDIPVVTRETEQTGNADRLIMWRLRQWGNSMSSDGRTERGRDFYALPLILIIGAWLAFAGWLGYNLNSLDETIEPDCRHQWTSDARFVEHCNFYDGRGHVEVIDE